MSWYQLPPAIFKLASSLGFDAHLEALDQEVNFGTSVTPSVAIVYFFPIPNS